jgi:hypothetical protein
MAVGMLEVTCVGGLIKVIKPKLLVGKRLIHWRRPVWRSNRLQDCLVLCT